MNDVSAMTAEPNRNAANVRIYCDDNERRWAERTDPNTGKQLGGWEDKENWILYPARVRPGCLFTSGGGFKKFPAETFREYMEGEAPAQQADVRATISVSPLCKRTLPKV